MRLSWNEIRARANVFAEDWKDAHYEKGETQSFYNDFFDVFGVKRRRVAVYEQHVKKLDDSNGYVDLFWPGVLLVEQKSAGRNLEKAREQALDYCANLKDEEPPRYILVSDFQNFSLYDLDERTDIHFKLADLHRHVEAFGFIVGVQKRVFRDEDPVNLHAAELMANIHDGLADTGYSGHNLEQYLVRLLFCLFADDTGIFERDIFLNFIVNRTHEDGSDLGARISEIFQILNTPEDARQTNLDEDLAAFPYINGDLFTDPLNIPAFNSALRNKLNVACQFDWGKVSPAIFGSLFQGVMDVKKRRQQGAHYTSEKNILKLIEPLFMDDLRRKFNTIKKLKTNRKKRLQGFHEEISKLTFFDPACGCGNFLVIAYRELRRLEIEILQEIFPKSKRVQLDIDNLSLIDVDQFYGIELDEFATRIAETALWMMDHIMNNELSLAFGKSFMRIPLQASPHIHHADALETDWNDVLPTTQCDYIFGNPPFGGAKLQTAAQRAQIIRIANLGGSGGTLDYVAAWFLKAGEYAQKEQTQIAFVATNSITQGEQVGMLWPLLFERYKLEIAFAHRSFAWESEARGQAHVHVVIIGLTRADMQPKKKRLFSYPDLKGEAQEAKHDALSPYLFDASKLTDKHLVVKEVNQSINGLPKMIMGSQPIDDGHYIFTEEQRQDFLKIEPDAVKFLRPFIGVKEFLNSERRWILSLQNASPNQLKNLPEVKKRIQIVKQYRLKSKRTSTIKLAQTPTHYQLNVIPETVFLLIPGVSTPRRDYTPIGCLAPPAIPSNATLCLPGATLDLFGILTSAMHMAWVRSIGGRLGNSYRYSVGVVYNTFPMPTMTERQKQALVKKAQAVLTARTAHKGTTLATLYDPDLMPPNLHRAHKELDKAVDRLYRKTPFNSERERVEYLFQLYEKMTSPLTAPRRKKRKRVTKK